MYRIGCCIPGGSFMPQGEKSTESAYGVLSAGFRVVLANGFDFAEATVGLLLSLSEAELAQAVADGVKIEVCNSFVPPSLSIMKRDAGLAAHVAEAMRRMSLLGCDTVVLGSGAARRVPEGMSAEEADAAFDAFLSLCETYAAKTGITVVLEPLNRAEANYMNLVSEGYAIVRRVSLPHIRLLADAYHMGQEGEPNSVLSETAPALCHIHVAERGVRTAPGTVEGSSFLPDFAKSLSASGYRGRVTVECKFRDFLAEVPSCAAYMKQYF